MKPAYIDTSYLFEIALHERAARPLIARLMRFDCRLSSNLLEAEFRSALSREALPNAAQLLSWLDWVLPDRPLTGEFARVLASGYLKGADLWHLACALSLNYAPQDLTFLTLDERQKAVARKLGFSV